MNESTTAPNLWTSNERPVKPGSPRRWVRPARVRGTSSAEQPWDHTLAADQSLRDLRWNRADREDLWALAACALAFAAAAISLALLV